MKKKHTYISIIICTKDRKHDFSNLINTILVQSKLPDEIIVVDSSNPVLIKNLFVEEYLTKGIEYKYTHTKPGLTYQRNVGVKNLNPNADIVFFFDDDLLLYPNYLSNIVELYENDADKRIGGIGGYITNVEVYSFFNTLYYSIFLLISKNYGDILLSGSNNLYGELSSNKYVKWLSGGNTSYRKVIFDEFSFDEKFSSYGLGEDLDFSQRVARRYKLLACANAKAKHMHSKESRPNYSKIGYMEFYNMYYIVSKNMKWYNIIFFVWSRMGILLKNTVGAISQKKDNIEYLKGNIRGIRDILLRRQKEKHETK